MAKNYDDIGGVWRTIGGRRVFIKNGQSLSEAMIESGKFKSAKEQEIEEEKRKKFNETMDKRASIINKLDEETKDLEDYDKYNLAVSKLEQTEGMQPTERQYWVGVKERYEKQEQARDHTFKMNDEEKKKYENVGKKIDDLTKEIDETKGLNKKLTDEDISYVSIATGSINDSYGYGLNEMLNTANREGLKVKNVEIGGEGQNKASIEFENGAKVDFYDLKNGKAIINNASTDDFQKIEEAINTYRVKSKEDVSYDFDNGGWINNNEDTKITGMNNSKYEDKWEAKSQSTNETMNKAIREKASKKSTFKEDLPKRTEIKEQGTSNRKEVSENIQAHILEYYDSPQDFIDQMDAMDYLPTKWHAGEELAKGGSYMVYYDEQRDFLDSLKINPNGKEFSDDKVFQTYTSLIGRESAKLYDRLKKNAYQKYKQEHPLTKMSFEEFKDMRK